MIRQFARRGGPQRQQKILSIARKSYPALMSSYKCADGKLLYVFAVDNCKLTENLLMVTGLTDRVQQEGYVLTSPYVGEIFRTIWLKLPICHGSGRRHSNLIYRTCLKHKPAWNGWRF